MAPNFYDNVFVNFGNALCIIKILASKILVLHIFSGYEYFKAVLKSSLPSPNEKLSCSCTVSSIGTSTDQ